MVLKFFCQIFQGAFFISICSTKSLYLLPKYLVKFYVTLKDVLVQWLVHRTSIRVNPVQNLLWPVFLSSYNNVLNELSQLSSSCYTHRYWYYFTIGCNIHSFLCSHLAGAAKYVYVHKVYVWKCTYHMGQEWAKENLLKVVFHKFCLVYSWIFCPIFTVIWQFIVSHSSPNK